MALQASPNQGRLLPFATAANRSFFVGVTGLTLTVTISKNSAAFGAAAGAVTEISSGWYKIALTDVDTGTEGDLAYHATDGGSNIVDWADQVAAPVKLADVVAHGGATAKLRLGTAGSDPAFWVSSSGGDAAKFETSAAGKNAFSVYGLGDGGFGLYCYGSSVGTYNQGSQGAVFEGNQGDGVTNLCGIYVSNGDSDDPACFIEGSTNGDGLKAVGAGVGKYAISLDDDDDGSIKGSLNGDLTGSFAEVGQESPAATNTLGKMLRYLFKAWRNKSTQTATAFKLYADDGTTVDQKATTSDDATTMTKGQIVSGP